MSARTAAHGTRQPSFAVPAVRCSPPRFAGPSVSTHARRALLRRRLLHAPSHLSHFLPASLSQHPVPTPHLSSPLLLYAPIPSPSPSPILLLSLLSRSASPSPSPPLRRRAVVSPPNPHSLIASPNRLFCALCAALALACSSAWRSASPRGGLWSTKDVRWAGVQGRGRGGEGRTPEMRFLLDVGLGDGGAFVLAGKEHVKTVAGLYLALAHPALAIGVAGVVLVFVAWLFWWSWSRIAPAWRKWNDWGHKL